MGRSSVAWQGRMWGRLVGEALRYPLRPRDHRRRLVDAYGHARGQVLPVMMLDEFVAGLPDRDGLRMEALERRPHNATVFEMVALGVITLVTRPRRALEIGTYDGRGTLAIALNAPECEVVTLNLPPDYIEDAADADHPDVKLSVKVASGERFLTHPEAGRITQVYGNSKTFDFSPYKPTQLVFIDGGHDTETAMHDSRRALEIIDQDRGAIVWHDATSFGVGAVTEQLYREGLPLRLIRGTDVALLRFEGGVTLG